MIQAIPCGSAMGSDELYFYMEWVWAEDTILFCISVLQFHICITFFLVTHEFVSDF